MGYCHDVILGLLPIIVLVILPAKFLGVCGLGTEASLVMSRVIIYNLWCLFHLGIH